MIWCSHDLVLEIFKYALRISSLTAPFVFADAWIAPQCFFYVQTSSCHMRCVYWPSNCNTQDQSNGQYAVAGTRTLHHFSCLQVDNKNMGICERNGNDRLGADDLSRFRSCCFGLFNCIIQSGTSQPTVAQVRRKKYVEQNLYYFRKLWPTHMHRWCSPAFLTIVKLVPWLV